MNNSRLPAPKHDGPIRCSGCGRPMKQCTDYINRAHADRIPWDQRFPWYCVDTDLMARVAKALPEFTQAFEPEGLKPEAFDAYGATVMTLDGFDKTGWQKLYTL